MAVTTTFTYGDPKVSNATLIALVNLLFGVIVSGGGSTAINYGWFN